MKNKIRWGLLSTARINNALIGPIKEAGRSELAGVASRNAEKAKAYAAEKGIPRFYGSYDEMLADPEIDAIYNSLPNTLHCEWTVKAAEAGQHVLCEKPITVSLEDFDRIEAAAKKNEVTIFEAFMYLHHPQTRKVQRLIADGKIGRVQLIDTWFNFHLPPENSKNIRLNQSLSGGAHWDVGVYTNSMAITMAGAGAPVQVFAHQIRGETGVDVAMRVQLVFSNGVAAQISSGFRTPPRAAAFIVGDAGILEITEPWKPGADGELSKVIFTGLDGEVETITFDPVNPYLCEVEAMESCVLDGAAPVVPLEQSREFLKSILATYESARTGSVVSI